MTRDDAPIRVRCRVRAGVIAGIGGAAALAACVKIDAAPNGIASVALVPVPPAIALGDVLRDTVGVAIGVHGTAYDVSGKAIPTATFRYAYVPYTPDTTTGAVIDNALVVDSATGAVRATATWVKSNGRVFARIGSLAIADSFAIVPPPSLVTDTTPTDTVLRYSCVDSRPGAVQTVDSTIGGLRNTAGPFTVTVHGDSAGTQIGVRRWLVRWSIDTAPGPIPTVSLAPTVKVPAIAIVANGTDQVIGYDTTDQSGTSNVRLRIRPPALGPGFVADTSYRVTLRADVIVGAGHAVPGTPIRGVFAVRLSRVPSDSCAH
ncbi:MAG TPA: hypothetical protein VGD56_19845 [Gemmatirosa sp.]